MQQFDSVKDSGEREKFSTGSVRDTRRGKGRFDLIPPGPLKRLAQHYENGSIKYGPRNWQKGQPLGRYLDSAMRHLLALLECQHDEDHSAALAWNAFAFTYTVDEMLAGRLPKDLDDIGFLTEIDPVLKPFEEVIREAFAKQFFFETDKQFEARPCCNTGLVSVRDYTTVDPDACGK